MPWVASGGDLGIPSEKVIPPDSGRMGREARPAQGRPQTGRRRHLRTWMPLPWLSRVEAPQATPLAGSTTGTAFQKNRRPFKSLGNGCAAEHATGMAWATGGRSSSEQSRGYLCFPTVPWQRSGPVYLGTIVSPADARHSQGSGRALAGARSSRLLLCMYVHSSHTHGRQCRRRRRSRQCQSPAGRWPCFNGGASPPSSKRFSSIPSCPSSGGCCSIIPVHTPSFHLSPARYLGCAPTGRGWPRRCHGKHASSLACPALRKQEAAAPVAMYLAVVSRSCDIQNWSQAGLRVVGVDGHLTAKECLGIKSITCRIIAPPTRGLRALPLYGTECAVLFCRYPYPMLTRRRPLFASYLPRTAGNQICRVWVVFTLELPGLDAFHKD